MTIIIIQGNSRLYREIPYHVTKCTAVNYRAHKLAHACHVTWHTNTRAAL